MGAGSGSGSFVTAWRYGPPSSVLAWLAALQASRNSSLTRASKWLGSSPILDVNLGPHTSWSETPDVPVSHHQYAETPRTSSRPKEIPSNVLSHLTCWSPAAVAGASSAPDRSKAGRCPLAQTLHIFGRGCLLPPHLASQSAPAASISPHLQHLAALPPPEPLAEQCAEPPA